MFCYYLFLLYLNLTEYPRYHFFRAAGVCALTGVFSEATVIGEFPPHGSFFL